ncbi:MAG TPA: toprim domain-containing protein [Dehalococcoidia bacterium]|nr:toprim domain-containing protein [Dehalococcoidia bacterium]
MSKFENLDQFLDLFPAKPRQRIKNGYNVLCPAHDDHDPSLSVSLDNHKVLLHCKAGCQTSQILTKLDLSEGDLFLSDSPTPTIETTYPYHDENGQLLFEVVRYKPKTFKARRPDSNGDWAWNIQGIKPVIYHLPDIKRAIAKGDNIYITEGERDCDSLWALGLIATTNPFGAGKWKPEYSKMLSRAKVIIVPDNDNEGRKHAIGVLESLEGTAGSLAVVEVPQTAKDITEWLEQGHSQEDFPSLKTLTTNEYNSNRDCVLSENLSSEVTKKSQRSHNFGIDDVRRFVSSQGFRYWEVRTLDYELGVSAPEDKRYRWRLLDYLENEKGEIEKHPTDGKKYRQISQNDVINYKVAALGKPLDLWLPFDIHNHFSVYPGNLLNFAGVTDSGKTALAVNIIRNNDDQWAIDYWTNELSAEELNERLQNIEPTKYIDDWNFNARVIQPGYLQKIRPGILSIFDYIDVGDPFYRISEEQQAIHDAIGGGVAVIFLQKDDARMLARGRGFSAQLPRLYISMNMKTAYAYKAKTPKNPNNPLKGKTCDFTLRNGVHFEFSEWRYKSD